MGFVKRKRGSNRLGYLMHTVVGTVKASKELSNVVKEMAKIVSEVERKVYDANEAAFNEAMMEEGIPEHAVSLLFKPYITFLSGEPLRFFAFSVEKGIDEYGAHEYMIDVLDAVSYAQGEAQTMQQLIPIADPRVIEKYPEMTVPYVGTALKPVSSILDSVRVATSEAIRMCSGLLGQGERYFSCLTKNLKKVLPSLRREAEKVDPESIKEELKEVYKALLEHGKKYGLGENIGI